MNHVKDLCPNARDELEVANATEQGRSTEIAVLGVRTGDECVLDYSEWHIDRLKSLLTGVW